MSSEKPDIHFEEKQYLGLNKSSLLTRSVIAIFCFLAYYFSGQMGLPEGQRPDEFLFFVGIAILAISLLLIFVMHIHTKVENGSVILDGLWTARKVKVDLASITSVEKVPYSQYLMNRPVYNLHRKGRIKFYTRGNEAVKLTDKDGLIYLIGSQKATELERVLKNRIGQTPPV